MDSQIPSLMLVPVISSCWACLCEGQLYAVYVGGQVHGTDTSHYGALRWCPLAQKGFADTRHSDIRCLLHQYCLSVVHVGWTAHIAVGCMYFAICSDTSWADPMLRCCVRSLCCLQLKPAQACVERVGGWVAMRVQATGWSTG